MPDYSLVPVDYQPDFDDYSLVPVDYDPFAADGPVQQAQFQQPPTPAQPAQPQPQTEAQQPATGAGQPGVNWPATGNSPSGSGGGAGVKRFGGDEGGDFPSRNAGIGFESADRAWDAALKEMKDLGAQHYPEEAKSRGFIPELGVEFHKRSGLYYYDQIARGFQHGALRGGVGLGDTGAVARGHMHWDSQFESKGDLDNARAYTQQVPDYNAWVGSWYGYRKYWHNGKPTGSPMPDWNRYKY